MTHLWWLLPAGVLVWINWQRIYAAAFQAGFNKGRTEEWRRLSAARAFQKEQLKQVSQIKGENRDE